MKIPVLATIGLATLATACGKPAAVQPDPQVAQTTAPAAGAGIADPAGVVANAIPEDRSTPEQRAEAEAAAAAANLPVTNESRGTWDCDNGETIELRFFPDQGIAVLVRGGENTELQQERVASGIKYSNGTTTIQGKGDEIILNVGMMATTKCLANRPAA